MASAEWFPPVPPTLVPVYADLTSPIGQPPLGVGGTSGMWKLCILGRELLVNDHLPLVIPHFTAKRIALWVGGGGWSDIYPTQTEDHKGDNDSLIQTRRYFRRVFFILALIHDTPG